MEGIGPEDILNELMQEQEKAKTTKGEVKGLLVKHKKKLVALDSLFILLMTGLALFSVLLFPVIGKPDLRYYIGLPLLVVAIMWTGILCYDYLQKRRETKTYVAQSTHDSVQEIDDMMESLRVNVEEMQRRNSSQKIEIASKAVKCFAGFCNLTKGGLKRSMVMECLQCPLMHPCMLATQLVIANGFKKMHNDGESWKDDDGEESEDGSGGGIPDSFPPDL